LATLLFGLVLLLALSLLTRRRRRDVTDVATPAPVAQPGA
jgi:LPXTG-motif cell wall-anchored protein